LKMAPIGAGPSNGRFFPPVTSAPTTLTLWAKGTGTVSTYVQYFSSTWASLGSATTTNITLSPTAFTSWTASYTAPVGTAIVQVALQNTNAAPWYVDDVSLTTGAGGGGSAGGPTTVTAPAGWMAVTSNAVAGVGLTTWRHVIAAVDPVSWSFALSQSVRAVGSISAYSGVDTANPIDASATGINAATGTAQSAPSVTTTGLNRFGVTVVASGAAVTATPPVGSTERADQSGGVGAPTSSIETSDFAAATAGATGAKLATTSAAAPSATATIALRPTGG
jgi:hypothetical protein